MPEPPHASGTGAPRNPCSAIFPKSSRWNLAVLVPVADVGQDLRLGERPGGLLDEPVLVGQGEVDHGRNASGWNGRPRRDSGRRARVTAATSYARGMTETAPLRPALPVDLAGSADHLTPILGRYFERSWSHGEGHRLYDTSGRAYLDFANGIAVTALGHRHPAVTAAIHAQVDRLIGPTGAMGYAEPVVRLSSMLADTLPETIDSVMFLNSGSEAIDGALKLARRVTGRPGIVAFRGGFHGRTFGATSVTTSNLNYRTGYEPLLPGVYFAPYPGRLPGVRGRRGTGIGWRPRRSSGRCSRP